MDRKALVVAVFLFATGARAEHPLITDDINTQGKGGWQLELNGERYRDRVDDERTVTRGQVAAVLTYGVLDHVDVQFGVPYQDNGVHAGAGDLALDVKWRLHESGPLKLGVKPGVTFPTGRDSEGLGSGRATWLAVGILSYETERGVFLANAGYRHHHNTLGEREDMVRFSAGVLPRVTQALRLVLDLAFDTNPDPAVNGWVRQMVLGMIYSVTRDFDLDVGYRRSNEPATHPAWMAGITLRW